MDRGVPLFNLSSTIRDAVDDINYRRDYVQNRSDNEYCNERTLKTI